MAKHYLKLSARLKKLLFDRDMKPVDLARALGIPPPTIHRLVTGKSTRPYKSSLKPIANYFSIEVDQLLGEEPLPSDSNLHADFLPSTNLIKSIPLTTWEDVGNVEKVRSSKKQIAVAGKINDDCFGLVMNDYSMEPLFLKKTILVFDPHMTPKDRSYILVKLQGNDTPIFRQLLIDVDHKYLKPLNPDLSVYKMRILNENDSIMACLFESRVNHEPDSETDIVEVKS